MGTEDNKDIYSELSKAIIKCYKQVDTGETLGNAFHVCTGSKTGEDLISWVYVDGGRKILLEIQAQYRQGFHCQILIEQIKFERSKAFWSVQVFDADRNVAEIVLAKSLTVGVLSPILRELKNVQHIGYLINSCKKFNRKLGV